MIAPSERYILDVAAEGFSWKTTSQIIQNIQRTFRQGKVRVPLVLRHVKPTDFHQFKWIKGFAKDGTTWVLDQWGPPGIAYVENDDEAGWAHEFGHWLLGPEDHYIQHCSGRCLKNNRGTIMTVGWGTRCTCPNSQRIMKWSNESKKQINSRLNIVARYI